MFYHSTWGTASRGLLTCRGGLGIAGLLLITSLLAFSTFSEASRAQPAKTSIITVISDSDSGPGSLRQAILDAQPGDVINFAPNLADATIRLTSGQLIVGNTLTIDGSTAPGISVSGNGASRVIRVTDTAHVRLVGLVITGGHTAAGASSAAGESGGGIYSTGVLTLTYTTVIGNIAGCGGRGDDGASANGNGRVGGSGGAGGGIYNEGALTLDHSSSLAMHAVVAEMEAMPPAKATAESAGQADQAAAFSAWVG